MRQNTEWPLRSRGLKHCLMDSSLWDEFEFRDDDIIVATWQKAGTTWLQQIIAQLVFQGKTEGIPISEISPGVICVSHLLNLDRILVSRHTGVF